MRLKKMLIFSLILTVFAVGCKKDEENNTENPTPPAAENTVKDIDGNVYKTVKINGLTWMAENLKTTKFNDGTPITYVQADSLWYDLTNGKTTPIFTYYDYTIENKDKYGPLYNAYAALGDLCPEGWHVATRADWLNLIEFANEAPTNQVTKTAAIALRATDSWVSETAPQGTDLYGFGAKANGKISTYGVSELFNKYAFFWCGDKFSEDEFNYAGINFMNALVYHDPWAQQGRSVRCVKD